MDFNAIKLLKIGTSLIYFPVPMSEGMATCPTTSMAPADFLVGSRSQGCASASVKAAPRM